LIAIDTRHDPRGRDAAAPDLVLERKLRSAKWAIFAGDLWLALWPPLAVCLIFLILSLFGLWAALDPDWHRWLLYGFGVMAFLSMLPLLRLRWPTRAAAMLRLERQSGLKHRPVTSYRDDMATPGRDEAALALWQAHRVRLAATFAKLRAGWPSPRVDRKDPFALRAALILVFAVALVAEGGQLREKVTAAFELKPSARSLNLRIDAWLTPPAYTRQPPVILSDGRFPLAAHSGDPAAFSVPENSEFVARIIHPDAGAFEVRLDLPGAETTEKFTASIREDREGVAEFRGKLTQSASIVVSEGSRVVARWPISVIDDMPPSIELTHPLALTQRNSLHIKFRVEDDYGVVSARAFINEDPAVDGRGDEPSPKAAPELHGKTDETEAPPRGAAVKRLGEPPVIALPLPRAAAKSGEGQAFKDLTSHPWAGLPVVMTLMAEDEAGQIGGTDAGRFILPERSFSQPLARALIEQRKKLVDRPDRPEPVALALDALAIAPETFTPDLSVYLGLRTLYWRLSNARGIEDIESAVAQLWDMAVNIEDGDLPNAERRLREAQEQLAKALDENASEEEIKRLMEELRQALSEFLQAMQQNARNRPMPQDMPQQAIAPQDLDRMLRNIEDLARTGSRDAARQLLSELQQMLENAQAGPPQPSGRMQEMMGMIDQLSELMRQQQQLLDETFRAQREQQGRNGRQAGDRNGEARPEGQQPGRRGERGERGAQGQGEGRNGERGRGQGQGPTPSLDELRQRQDALRRELDDLRNAIPGLDGNARQRLEDAARAMGEAGEQLGERNAERAAEREAAAVESLRQGARALAEQMMQSRQGQQGQGFDQTGNAGRDPLGRPNRTFGTDEGDDVKVPDEIDVQRAREILDELRRRLGERYRPELELDYLDRLIKRF
jgi:uncharacterized protein (TIGR02302 family)